MTLYCLASFFLGGLAVTAGMYALLWWNDRQWERERMEDAE